MDANEKKFGESFRMMPDDYMPSLSKSPDGKNLEASEIINGKTFALGFEIPLNEDNSIDQEKYDKRLKRLRRSCWDTKETARLIEEGWVPEPQIRQSLIEAGLL